MEIELELELEPLKNILSHQIKKFTFNHQNISLFVSFINKLIVKYENEDVVDWLYNFVDVVQQHNLNNKISCLQKYIFRLDNKNLFIDLISYFDVRCANEMIIIRHFQQQTVLLEQLNKQLQTIQQLNEELLKSK